MNPFMKGAVLESGTLNCGGVFKNSDLLDNSNVFATDGD